jgi:hypothetical protein
MGPAVGASAIACAVGPTLTLSISGCVKKCVATAMMATNSSTGTAIIIKLVKIIFKMRSLAPQKKF